MHKLKCNEQTQQLFNHCTYDGMSTIYPIEVLAGAMFSGFSNYGIYSIFFSTWVLKFCINIGGFNVPQLSYFAQIQIEMFMQQEVLR